MMRSAVLTTCALAIWLVLVTAAFVSLNLCYFNHRSIASPPINYSHITIGIAGELVHIGLCAALIWAIRSGAGIRTEHMRAIALVALVSVASPLAVRHGALKGDEDKAIFQDDPCICRLEVGPAPAVIG